MEQKTRKQKIVLFSLTFTTLLIFLTIVLFKQIAPTTGVSASAADYSRRHTPTPVHARTPTPGPIASITSTPAGTPTVTPAPGSLQMFVEPAAGEQVILNAVNNAHQSVWLEMYLLSDQNVIQALKSAAGRHLDVRVMLEPHPYGGGSPQATLDALKAAGASVADSSPSFALTHEKGMIIDASTAFIMTCNFTFSALNGKNREYGIIDTVPQDVQEVTDIFNADWNRTTVQLGDPALVVSPSNSRNDLTTLITSAQHSLIIEAEELQDTGIEQAIASAAGRGVQVQVILPTPQKQPDANSPGITMIKAAGAQVKEDPQLIMHAKMLVVDGNKGFVGSENFSSYSLDKNREVGLLISNPLILTTLQQTFQQDWNISQSQVQCLQWYSPCIPFDQ